MLLFILGMVIVLVELVVLELDKFWDPVIGSANSSISIVSELVIDSILVLILIFSILYFYKSIVIRVYRWYRFLVDSRIRR